MAVHPLEIELRTRRHKGGVQPQAKKQREDFITLVPGLREAFMVWREGARQPQSYHHTEAAAIEMAGKRCRPGERLYILRAEIVGAVECAKPVVNYSTSLKGGAA